MTHELIEAQHWSALENGRVACHLCPQRCIISDGGHGLCLGRVNRQGTLYAENFGECVSASMDPIEKKPLYHVCPGRSILSIATYGCNLRCEFCQNWSISQTKAPTERLSPEQVVALAKRNGSFGIAYTYTEPIIWYEYLMATGDMAHAEGLKNVLVTNGIINEKPLRELLPFIDAMNIDLKSMSPEFYRDLCHVDGLDSVKRTIELAHEQCHIELTNLLISGVNDSEEELRELVDFVAGVSPSIPVHFSRYFPNYKMDAAPTPAESLALAERLAKEKLHYVYLGNVGLETDSNTYCPDDGHLLVRRTGYAVEVVGVEDGRCERCGRTADFLWCD
jgi:pyruvate formate lyase activating enzyme